VTVISRNLRSYIFRFVSLLQNFAFFIVDAGAGGSTLCLQRIADDNRCRRLRPYSDGVVQQPQPRRGAAGCLLRAGRELRRTGTSLRSNKSKFRPDPSMWYNDIRWQFSRRVLFSTYCVLCSTSHVQKSVFWPGTNPISILILLMLFFVVLVGTMLFKKASCQQEQQNCSPATIYMCYSSWSIVQSYWFSS